MGVVERAQRCQASCRDKGAHRDASVTKRMKLRRRSRLLPLFSAANTSSHCYWCPAQIEQQHRAFLLADCKTRSRDD